MAGAFGRVRASEKYALGNGCIRRLPVRRPAGHCGVWIERCPGSSGAGGPCRGLVLRERVRIRAVAGVRPRWSANAGSGRRLVRPARWPDGHPCSGLAAGQPQRQRRDGEVRRGYPACHPGTRPDMAGRQRQPVPVTCPAGPLRAPGTPARLTPVRARQAADQDAFSAALAEPAPGTRRPRADQSRTSGPGQACRHGPGRAQEPECRAGHRRARARAGATTPPPHPRSRR
jgi:hypothetical protein